MITDTSGETLMENKKTRVLITGASGFIGHCLKSLLSANDYEIILAYNTNKLNSGHYEVIQKNLLEESLYDEFIKFNPEVVIHCAGLNPSVLMHKSDDLFYLFNRDVTLNIAHDFLKFCKISNNHITRKFINLSTYEIYGNINELKGFDEFSDTNPMNAYADSKAQAVKEIESMDEEQIKFVNIICTNNFGPQQSRDKLIPAVFEKLIHDQEITIHGDGTSQRTWTFVKDTCDGILKVVDLGLHKRYHISSDDHISVIGIINSLHSLLKSKNIIKTSSAKLNWCKAGSNPIFKINSKWSQEQLKWKAKTPFLKGLEQTTEHLSNH